MVRARALPPRSLSLRARVSKYTPALAHMLDSLVRVSRRGKGKHFDRAKGASALPRSRPRRERGVSDASTLPPPRSDPAAAEPALSSEGGQHGSPRAAGNTPPQQHCFPSVPFQQFQALFNSLSKVLFIFPSRYLFAIGLPPVFSLGWNLPPALSCNPKQLDSSRPDRTPRKPNHGRGCHPPRRPLPRDLGRMRRWPRLYRLQFAWVGDSQRGLFPLHSPLLGESWLVSFPPLSYMLKFSGSSCLIGGPRNDDGMGRWASLSEEGARASLLYPAVSKLLIKRVYRHTGGEAGTRTQQSCAAPRHATRKLTSTDAQGPCANTRGPRGSSTILRQQPPLRREKLGDGGSADTPTSMLPG
jgi:hypothetical protein